MIRAGVVVTGTEVLNGAITDRNGPWLSRRLQELGVEVAQVTIVGDRPADMRHTLAQVAEQGVEIVITSGGLGPTADDRTVEVVADWLGRKLILDDALKERIGKIIARLRRSPVDAAALDEGNRKQAMVPEGAHVLDPIGTAPGLVIAPARPEREPTVVVLPGPPRELQPMWEDALASGPMRQALADLASAEVRTMRLYGTTESRLAQTLREAEEAGVELARLEVTTCQHRGELEVTTRVTAPEVAAYEAFESFMAARHPKELFSTDGSTVDEQVAAGLLDGGLNVATAESCTGGMIAARLTDLAGSSRYVRGGLVVYSNEAKVAQARVPAELIERHGAVSAEVAEALARGAREALDAEVGVGVTGVAGPGGGSESKPVGLVWLAVAGPGDGLLLRSVKLPGERADVRERAVTVAMHMLRSALASRRALGTSARRDAG